MPPHTLTAATLIVYPNKLRYSEVVKILPCLYNLPIKTVQKTLKLSHATLAKARMELGLSRWPYESILQERFVDKQGKLVLWDDVDSLQREMMGKVDRRVAVLLNKITEEAHSLRKKTGGKRVALKPDSEQDDEGEPQKKKGRRSTPSAPPASPNDHSWCEEETGQPNNKNMDAVEEEDDGVDCLLLQALMEDETQAPVATLPEGSYWQGYNLELYRILDPYNDTSDTFLPSLLEWDP
jgi:hypothetical protein